MKYLFWMLSALSFIGGVGLAVLVYLQKKITFSDSDVIWIIGIPVGFILSLVFSILYSKVKYSDIINREKKIKKEAEQVENEREELKDARLKIEETENLSERNERLNKLIQSSKTHKELAGQLIEELAKETKACQGMFYLTQRADNVRALRLIGSYAYNKKENEEVVFEFGEGLAGQVAQEGRLMSFDNIPDGYIEVLSGLGKSSPKNLCLFPLKYGEDVLGLIEIASFENFTNGDIRLFERLEVTLGAAINLLNLQEEIKTIKAS